MLLGAPLPFGLGETEKGTDADGNIVQTDWAGKLFILSDEKVSDPRLAPRRVGRQLIGMPILNNSGVTLYGKRFARLKRAGGFGDLWKVDGYPCVLNEKNLVFIDEYLATSGVPDKYYFWGLVAGPVTLLTASVGADFNGDIAIGNLLVAATGATTQDTAAGRVSNITIANATDAAGAQAGAANIVARALSARTTANTNSDLLALLMMRY